MSDKSLILALAKVIIAVAWADGEVTQEEVNSLKDLLFELPHAGFESGIQLSAREWAMLDMYLEAPIDAAERERLVADLQANLRTGRQKRLALRALDAMVRVDGLENEAEREVASDVTAAVEAAEVGGLAALSKLLNGAVQRRTEAVAGAPNRERFFTDFVHNKVFYALRRRLQLDGGDLDIPEAQLRKLSLAGGLMAQVAYVDRDVTDGEVDSIIWALRESWGLSLEQATFVAEVAVSAINANYDGYRMQREFTRATTRRERIAFLDVLFAVAAGDGFVSHAETEEIRIVARAFMLSNREFIAAKVKIPRQQRAT